MSADKIKLIILNSHKVVINGTAYEYIIEDTDCDKCAFNGSNSCVVFHPKYGRMSLCSATSRYIYGHFNPELMGEFRSLPIEYRLSLFEVSIVNKNKVIILDKNEKG